MSAVTSARLARLSLRKACTLCFFALCFSFSPLLHAQNSGGGWVAQPTNQLGPYRYNQIPYDWTGFTISGTSVSNNGMSNTGSETYYSVFNGHGVLVGSSYDRSDTTTSSGASTYEWLWTPTGSNVGAPPPPLYVLAIGSAVADLSYSGSTNGLSGSGTLTYPQTVTVSDYTAGPTSGSQVMLYQLPLASGSPNVSVSIGPVIKHSYSGTSPGNFGAITEVLQTSGCPIIVSAPNPMNRPDLGDGTNQYVYDATPPSATAPYGFLKFPGSIQTVGAVAADTAWLMRDPTKVNGLHNSVHVDFTVDLPKETVEDGWNLYDQTILSSVPADTIAVKNGSYNGPSSSMADGFLYAGLPKMNSGLGNHLVTLTVDGSASQQAHIQTFFSALANNYPSASADYAASSTDSTQRFYTPNWFYYYNQIYTATGKYQVGGQTYTDFTASPYKIYIEDQTYGTIGGIHIYALKPGASTISWAGDIQLSGAWLYIMICAHEKEHQDACTDGTYAIDKTNPDMPVMLTSDNDRLDNTWEDNHYFDSTTSNTTGAPAYGNETDAADDEAIADIVGLGVFLDQISDWKQDWAGVPGGANYQGGLQFGTSHFAIRPGDKQPSPYFLFTPVTKNANGSFSYGTPIKIWSKADLTAAVPNLMTSLLTKPTSP